MKSKIEKDYKKKETPVDTKELELLNFRIDEIM